MEKDYNAKLKYSKETVDDQIKEATEESHLEPESQPE